MATAVKPAPATMRVTIELDLADALGVGNSLRMQARSPRTPQGTRDIFERVGEKLVAAGREAIRTYSPVKP
jgi:hypothetical protein